MGQEAHSAGSGQLGGARLVTVWASAQTWEPARWQWGPRCLSGTSWAPRPPASPTRLVWLPHVPSRRAPAGPFRSPPTPGWGSSSCFASRHLAAAEKTQKRPKLWLVPTTCPPPAPQ